MKKSDVLIVPKDRSLYFFPAISEMSVCSGKELLAANNEYLRQYLKDFQLIIFLDYGFEPEMAAKIRPFTKAKIVLFFWNHFKLEHYRKLNASQKEPAINEIYHFDPLEARDLVPFTLSLLASRLMKRIMISFLVPMIMAESSKQWSLRIASNH